jgi:Transport and Golgi organisation 2
MARKRLSGRFTSLAYFGGLSHIVCTIVILRRPNHRWPLLLAANRDEMADRPWRPPGRHWPDRPDVVGGLDELAGGTWCAINDNGVVAAVLNRINTLGPAPGLRSRGELPLEALDHAEAHTAAAALADLNPHAYRPFNLFVADARDAYWIRLSGGGDTAPAVNVLEVPEGYSMITAYDRNDLHSPRIRRYLPLFRAAAVPDPDAGDWAAWAALLALREHDPEAGPGGAMNVVTPTGFGTICSSLLALPAVESDDGDSAEDEEIRPIWRFAAWTDAPGDYITVAL